MKGGLRNLKESKDTELPAKDESVKTIYKSSDRTIPRLTLDACLEYSLLRTYLMIWQRKKQVYSGRES